MTEPSSNQAAQIINQINSNLNDREPTYCFCNQVKFNIKKIN